MFNRNSMADQNPWWQNGTAILDDSDVRKAMAARPARRYEFGGENMLVLGTRQVGKTTYMKLMARELMIDRGVDPRNVLFFSCEALSGKEDILSLASAFGELPAREGRRYLFLDEVSFVKDWNVALLHLFNSGYMRDKRIVVSGSSSVALQKETLPGRAIEKRVMYPLGFSDYFDLVAKDRPDVHTADLGNVRAFHKAAVEVSPYASDMRRLFNAFAFRSGGYLPCIYCDLGGTDPIGSYYEIYKDTLLSDVAKLGRSERIFRETMYGIMSHYGSTFSANAISNDTSIRSHKTVEEYVGLMRGMFAIDVAYKRVGRKTMYRSNRKAYLSDPFLYRVMKRYSMGLNSGVDDLPKIIEGMVANALARRLDTLAYYSTTRGKEVDFVHGDIGIEVKSSGDVGDLNMGAGYVVDLGDDLKIGRTGRVAKIPLPIFLYLLGKMKPEWSTMPPLF